MRRKIRVLLPLLSCFLFALTSLAQTSKGAVLLGGSLHYSREASNRTFSNGSPIWTIQKTFNAKPDQMVVMNKVAAKIKELGMYTFVRWSYIFIAPPLCITKEQIDEGLTIISEAIKIADEAP